MPAQSTERAKIMDAAYRTLVASKGSSLSVNEVLRVAGLSTRAFYRHFDSKDELLLALFRRDAERLTGMLRAAAEADTPPRALTAFIEAMLRVPADPRRRQRALILSAEESTRARGYGAERHRFQVELETVLIAILNRGRTDGTFPWVDPGPDARSVRAVLMQAFDEQITGTAPMPAAESARQVTDFALRAVGINSRLVTQDVTETQISNQA